MWAHSPTTCPSRMILRLLDWTSLTALSLDMTSTGDTSLDNVEGRRRPVTVRIAVFCAVAVSVLASGFTVWQAGRGGGEGQTSTSEASVFDTVMGRFGDNPGDCPFVEGGDLPVPQATLLDVSTGVDELPAPTPNQPAMQIRRVGCVFNVGNSQIVLTLIHSPMLDALYVPAADPRQPELVAQRSGDTVVVAVKIAADVWLGVGGSGYDDGALTPADAATLVEYGNAVRIAFGMAGLSTDVQPSDSPDVGPRPGP